MYVGNQITIDEQLHLHSKLIVTVTETADPLCALGITVFAANCKHAIKYIIFRPKFPPKHRRKNYIFGR
jgi:hypothetical protein